MTLIAERTVLFADLRGSTSLFETLGNAEATSVVTHTITTLANTVPLHGGKVIKTLGDGLMAVFGDAGAGIDTADNMHHALESIVQRGSQRGASAGLRALRLQIALARGEVVEMGGDCYGDAVNVAARLLDHAGDNETLITTEVLANLPSDHRSRFRNLDRLHLRGRAEPVQVHVIDGQRANDSPTTMYGDFGPASDPQGIRLTWMSVQRVFSGATMPVVLGRSPQATYCIDDSRVSRSHARVDWHGGSFQLTDLSYNGTFVRFAGETKVITLRRTSCTLHGHGAIGLGTPPIETSAPSVTFEVLHFSDTMPHEPLDFAPRR
jgi:class 3 adenylate cyclase